MGDMLRSFVGRIQEAREITSQQITSDDQRFTERELRSASTDSHKRHVSPDFSERLRERLAQLPNSSSE